MRSIEPHLFNRLMRLPESARADLLEFLGATSVGPAQLAAMISALAARRDPAGSEAG